jgi:hypothetical protein
MENPPLHRRCGYFSNAIRHGPRALFLLFYRGACDGNVAPELLLDIVVRRLRVEDRGLKIEF